MGWKIYWECADNLRIKFNVKEYCSALNHYRMWWLVYLEGGGFPDPLPQSLLCVAPNATSWETAWTSRIGRAGASHKLRNSPLTNNFKHLKTKFTKLPVGRNPRRTSLLANTKDTNRLCVKSAQNVRSSCLTWPTPRVLHANSSAHN